MANTSVEMVLKILFLTFSNPNVLFPEWKFTWRSYIAANALLTFKHMEVIDKNKFAKVAADKNIEAFVMHVTSLNLCLILIYLARKAQIAFLLTRKVSISNKYLDFNNAFLEKKFLVLLKITDLNQHTIKLQDSQQLFYRPISSLGLVELKILKNYIKTNLANSFI